MIITEQVTRCDKTALLRASDAVPGCGRAASFDVTIGSITRPVCGVCVTLFRRTRSNLITITAREEAPSV